MNNRKPINSMMKNMICLKDSYRGIISCKNSPTEALPDYVDFKLNPSMKKMKSYIKDNKHVIQILEEANESEIVNEGVKIVTADIDNMYGNMPLELSEWGVKTYFDNLDDDEEKLTTNEIIYAQNCARKIMF